MTVEQHVSGQAYRQHPIAAMLVLATLAGVLVAVGLPLSVGVYKVVSGLVREGGGGGHALMPRPLLLLKTLGWAGGVGALATLLAWPAGWWLGRRGWKWAGFVLVPMMLPSYLCYAAYGLARAPGSLLGNWTERMADGGWPLAPLVTGRMIAVAGLALWAWPLAALILASHVRVIDAGVLEALTLDGAGFWRRLRVRMSMCRMGFMMGFCAVTLVMLGSAVPFHVGQVATYAMVAWQGLNLDPTGWSAWGSAWPLVMIGVVLGWWLGGHGAYAAARGLVGSGQNGTDDEGTTNGVWHWWGGVAVWVLSVLVPLGLLVGSVRRVGSFIDFWSVAGPGVARSAWMAGWVGCATVWIALVVWFGMQWGGIVRVCSGLIVRTLLVGALVPGILVGAGLAMVMGMLPAWVGETDVGVFAAHMARFGCVGALAGCWFAGQEPREVRDARVMDGGAGVLGWAMGSVRGSGGALVGVFAAGSALSLHELEAAVMLQSPGVLSLAQTMLGWLHYARYEELSAGGATIIGIALVVVLAGAWGAWGAMRVRRR